MTDTETQAAEIPTDLSGVEADHLAGLVANASDEQLNAGMADPEAREKILDEIFRRMSEHVDPAKARGQDAVLHFRIAGKPGGGEDVYEVELKDGVCTVSEEPASEPKVAFTVGPAAFLRLVSGNQAGPVLFMSGKLKIEGDLMFASQVATFFRIPQAA